MNKQAYKFNFGTAIYTFLILFVCLLIFVVFKSRSIDHSLVIDDYYDKDIHYQEQFDKVSNTNKLGLENRLMLKTDDPKYLVFEIEDKTVKPTGNISFYRPSDKSLDFNKSLSFNETGKCTIDRSLLSSGKWKVKVDWKANDVDYYNEYEIYN